MASIVLDNDPYDHFQILLSHQSTNEAALGVKLILRQDPMTIF